MSVLEAIRATLQKLQSYAAEYFKSLYTSSVVFWVGMPVPTGANVLTGVFAYFMIYAARKQLAQDSDVTTMGQILFYGTLMLLITCGILVVFDPSFSRNRLDMWRRLVSIICIGSILGCIFIVLDAVIPWVNWVFAFANYEQWFSAANVLVAICAAFFAFIVLVANSIPKLPNGVSLLKLRSLAWCGVILALLILTIHLLVTKTYA